jgi:hypothetical protein
MKFDYISFLLLASRSVFSLVNLKDIIDIDTDRKIEITSKDSLLEGLLLYETHTLHNLRFYTPIIERFFKHDDNLGWYIAKPKKDCESLQTKNDILVENTIDEVSTYNSIMYSLCRLFPSPNGYLCISTGGQTNLESTLTKISDENRNQRDDLKILAAMLFCINYKIKAKFSSDITDSNKENEYKNLRFEIIDTKFKINLNYLESKKKVFNDILLKYLNILLIADETQVHYLFSPSIIFKAYICFYIKSYEELKIFYDQYNELFDELKITKKYESKIEFQQLLKEIYMSESLIPYKMNSTPTSATVPFYLGNDDFDKTSFFFKLC